MKRIGFAVFGFLLFLTFSGVWFVEAVTPDPANCVRYANHLDVVALQGKIPLGTCIDASTEAAVKPQLSGAALLYLKSLPRQEKSACRTAEDKNLEKLDPNFKICAAQFIKAYTDKYGVTIRINSAYRDNSEQACVCKGASMCAPIGASKHQLGVAMDITPSDEDFKKLHSFAIENPNLGVCFPFSSVDKRGRSIKTKDPYHMIIGGLKGSREGARCAALGITASCTGQTVTVTPQPKPASPIRKYFREQQQKSECQALSQECLSGGGQECLSRYYQQCQGGAPIPTGGGGQPSGGGAQSAGGSQSSGQSQPKSVSTSVSSEKNNSTNQNTSSNQSTSTTQTVTVNQESSDILSSVFGSGKTATTSQTSEEVKGIENIISMLEEIASGVEDQSTTTKVRSIEIPLPELVDVATVFEQRSNIEIKNIEYLSDDIVSIEVQLREPDGTSGVSGFFGPAGDTFAVPIENAGVINRVCRERPWDGVSITSTIVSPVFDSVCKIVGAEVGEETFDFHAE